MSEARSIDTYIFYVGARKKWFLIQARLWGWAICAERQVADILQIHLNAELAAFGQRLIAQLKYVLFRVYIIIADFRNPWYYTHVSIV